MGSLRDHPFFQQARSAGRVVVDEPPKFDLESYIANYKGRTRYERLYLIGTSSTYLCLEALKAAVAEAKDGADIARYDQGVSTLAKIAPDDPDAVEDAEWKASTQTKIQAETRRMESELKGYKNNLIKESIRMGYQDLGLQYQSIGDLANATKSFSKMYDFMTRNNHVVIMCLYLIQVAIDQQNWYAVTMNAQRVWLNGTAKYDEAKKQSAKITSALGIAELANRNYRVAAERFLATDPRMVQAKLDDPHDEEAYNEILTPNDVAIYGALCALASYDRSELQSKVIENKTFRNYLELEPHMRRAISFFISSKYSACLAVLESWRVDYLLDIYLQPCFNDIFERIQRKAIQQFFIPFSCVSFQALATAFNTDEGNMMTQLTLMISRGDIDARLDLVRRVLVAREQNKRAAVLEGALESAQLYYRTAHLRLLRMGCISAGLEVKAPSKERNGGAGGKQLAKDGPLDSSIAGDIIDVGGSSGAK